MDAWPSMLITPTHIIMFQHSSFLCEITARIIWKIRTPISNVTSVSHKKYPIPSAFIYNYNNFVNLPYIDVLSTYLFGQPNS